jgi:hypothetical protein
MNCAIIEQQPVKLAVREAPENSFQFIDYQRLTCAVLWVRVVRKAQMLLLTLFWLDKEAKEITWLL